LEKVLEIRVSKTASEIRLAARMPTSLLGSRAMPTVGLGGARRLAGGGLLAAIAALMLAACGGSSPASSGSSPSGASSASSTSMAASSGKQIFTSAGCASCHTLAAAHATGSIGPNLDQLKPSEAAVVTQVTNGGGGMPSFAGSLSKSQITAVAKFVASSTH
jgi:mono/diheme cytochrome c family protein